MLACPANTEARGFGSRPVSPRDFRDAAKIGTVKNKFECEEKKEGGGTQRGSLRFRVRHARIRENRLAGSLSLSLGCHRFFLLSLPPLLFGSRYCAISSALYSRPLFATIVTSFFFRDFFPASSPRHSAEDRTYCLFSSGAYV